MTVAALDSTALQRCLPPRLRHGAAPLTGDGTGRRHRASGAEQLSPEVGQGSGQTMTTRPTNFNTVVMLDRTTRTKAPQSGKATNISAQQETMLGTSGVADNTIRT